MIELEFTVEQYEFVCKYVPIIKTFEKSKCIKNDLVKIEMSEKDFLDFQNHYDSSIIYFGMDNQDTVNDIGIELYKIYDECIY